MLEVASSTSTNSGPAPTWEMASVVAMNVFGTVITASPAATPAACKANRRASVPLPTPTQYFAPQNSANSRSNLSTVGPPMNPAVDSARWNAATNSCSSCACGVIRSRNGTTVLFIFSPLLQFQFQVFEELERDYQLR